MSWPSAILWANTAVKKKLGVLQFTILHLLSIILIAVFESSSKKYYLKRSYYDTPII